MIAERVARLKGALNRLERVCASDAEFVQYLIKECIDFKGVKMKRDYPVGKKIKKDEPNVLEINEESLLNLENTPNREKFFGVRSSGSFKNNGFYLPDYIEDVENVRWEIIVDDERQRVLIPIKE